MVDKLSAFHLTREEASIGAKSIKMISPTAEELYFKKTAP